MASGDPNSGATGSDGAQGGSFADFAAAINKLASFAARVRKRLRLRASAATTDKSPTELGCVVAGRPKDTDTKRTASDMKRLEGLIPRCEEPEGGWPQIKVTRGERADRPRGAWEVDLDQPARLGDALEHQGTLFVFAKNASEGHSEPILRPWVVGETAHPRIEE